MADDGDGGDDDGDEQICAQHPYNMCVGVGAPHCVCFTHAAMIHIRVYVLAKVAQSRENPANTGNKEQGTTN